VRTLESGPPEIGRTYLVPCLVNEKMPGLGYLPVWGGKHSDPEIIGNPAPHWHFDLRVFTPRQIDAAVARFEVTAATGQLYANVYWGNARPELRRRLCFRDWPEYPDHGGQFIEKKIAPSMAAARLDLCRLACPHRGADLRQVRPATDGTITCPMHGLRWDAKTGELRSRLEAPGDRRPELRGLEGRG